MFIRRIYLPLPPQNVSLSELTLMAERETWMRKGKRGRYTLEWMNDPELRRRVHVGLNKGEARNALARAVFFNRQGDLRDRSFENQRYRASGLNLIVAAIILWNTVYLEHAVADLRGHGIAIDDETFAHVSPIGWEHVNLTGDYTWPAAGRLRKGPFRPLRPFAAANEVIQIR
jgi:hypothetical protein